MSRLTKNIAYNLGGQGLSVVLSFVAVRFVFRGLGGDALGLIYFNLSVSMAMMMALELGIYKTIVREVASHHQSDPAYIRNLIGTATAFYWSGYIVLAIAAYALAPVLVKHWVHLATMPSATAIRVLRILAFGTLVTLPRGLYDSLLVGLERMGHTNILRVAITATQQAGIFVVLLLHGGLFAVAYWIVFSCFAGIAAYYWVCGRSLSFGFLWPRFEESVVRKNWRFSTQVLSISIAAWFIVESDKLVVSRLLPLALVGFYTVAKSAVSRCSMLTAAINEATYPHMSRLYNSGDLKGLHFEYERLHDAVCLGIVPIYAALLFGAFPLFSIVLNPQVARLLLMPVAILALGGYLDGTITVPNVIALAAGRPDIGLKQNTLAAVSVILGCVVFTKLWGLTGASLSFVIFPVVGYAYGIPRIQRECLKLGIASWYARVGKILALALSTFGLVWGLLYSQGKTGIVWLGVGYLVAVSLYLSLGYLSVGRTLGDSLRDLLRRMVSKPAGAINPAVGPSVD